MHLSISRIYLPLIFHVLVCVFVCLRASFCLFVLSVVCHFKCFSFYYVVLCIVCAFLLLMPEKVSSVLKTLSLCNCHNFIFSLSFCGILAFTLSYLSPSLFKPVPIALQSQSLNKFFNGLARILAELLPALLPDTLRLPNVFLLLSLIVYL